MSNNTQSNTTNNAQNEWRNREIGALWKRESKGSGKKYLAGHVKVNELGTETVLKIVVFPNITKKNEKSPDFVVYVSKESEASQSAAKATPQKSKSASVPDKVQSEETEEVL
jgi:uncharacterized protein (DUF736 family)